MLPPPGPLQGRRSAAAARWNPQLGGVNFNWGLASFKAEQYKDAITPLESELQTQPHSIPAKQLLGLSYFAWWETLPDAETQLPNAVRPGDHMTVAITNRYCWRNDWFKCCRVCGPWYCRHNFGCIIVGRRIGSNKTWGPERCSARAPRRNLVPRDQRSGTSATNRS